MAGLGRKTWSALEVVTAANVQGYLQDQVVQVYAGTAAAGSALGTAVSEGMIRYLSDSNEIHKYTGSSWEGIAPVSGNAIINGAFDWWQRGTSFSITSGSWNYTADRWASYWYGGTLTVSQQAFTPGSAPVAGYEGAYFARFSSNTTAVAARTLIEDVRTFAGQTVTISFFAKSASAQTLLLTELSQNFGSGGSATVYTPATAPAITTSWARYTMTVTLPSISGKTIGSSSYLGLEIKGAANNALDIWGVQLEAGSVATPFRRNANSIQAELAACQRYYQRHYASTRAVGSFYTTTACRINLPLEVQMRAAPTVTVNSAYSVDAVGNGSTTTFAASNVGSTITSIQFDLGGASPARSQFQMATWTGGAIEASAEL